MELALAFGWTFDQIAALSPREATIALEGLLERSQKRHGKAQGAPAAGEEPVKLTADEEKALDAIQLEVMKSKKGEFCWRKKA